MDPLTHGLLGASCGQALFGRALGRRALVWGAVLGMAPDIDVVAKAAGPLAEWTWHRSVTHSLLLLPLVGLVAGYALGRWKGGALSSWIGLAVVALVSHPLLDFCTSYGTQLLAPFSDRRFALDAAGRPLGPGERFDRQLPAPASRLLLTLWRETLGLS